MREEEGQKRINSYLKCTIIMWVFIFSFTRERLREEKRTKAGRREGGDEG